MVDIGSFAAVDCEYKSRFITAVKLLVDERRTTKKKSQR